MSTVSITMTESETSIYKEESEGMIDLMRSLRQRAIDLRDGTGAMVEIRTADGQVVALVTTD